MDFYILNKTRQKQSKMILEEFTTSGEKLKIYVIKLSLFQPSCTFHCLNSIALTKETLSFNPTAQGH